MAVQQRVKDVNADHTSLTPTPLVSADVPVMANVRSVFDLPEAEVGFLAKSFTSGLKDFAKNPNSAQEDRRRYVH
ncbi:hypothetical protein M514_05202 [Trichuris suis]|uniref:Uncharacterized protein n=1 Tax=Trichuris suis TaxID=68888 RepID=A0A085MU79_9BILA|nr:hypothetical protein M513_05202 [Trichuris suis]KFD60775.1 hypothetical protein M514_05202 [Trichuris suis]